MHRAVIAVSLVAPRREAHALGSPVRTILEPRANVVVYAPELLWLSLGRGGARSLELIVNGSFFARGGLFNALSVLLAQRQERQLVECWSTGCLHAFSKRSEEFGPVLLIRFRRDGDAVPFVWRSHVAGRSPDPRWSGSLCKMQRAQRAQTWQCMCLQGFAFRHDDAIGWRDNPFRMPRPSFPLLERVKRFAFQRRKQRTST